MREDVDIDEAHISDVPDSLWHPAALCTAQKQLEGKARENWVWWRLPAPALRNLGLTDLVEEDPSGVKWHTAVETKRLIGMMNDTNRQKVEQAKLAGRRVVGTVYKRTRPNGPNGERVQRAEVRFDDVAGCLRTPAGGSSRQTIMIVEGKKVRSRLLSPREAARLMGLPDEYILPAKYNEAYHLAGDGVAVPVVRFIAETILEPILEGAGPRTKKAA